jgi:hypothetical protein
MNTVVTTIINQFFDAFSTIIILQTPKVENLKPNKRLQQPITMATMDCIFTQINLIEKS